MIGPNAFGAVPVCWGIVKELAMAVVGKWGDSLIEGGLFRAAMTFGISHVLCSPYHFLSQTSPQNPS